MKPVELCGSFRAKVRLYPKDARNKIGQALRQLEQDFGHPHRHRGLGIRKLTGQYFEIRIGLDMRIVFQNRPESFLILLAGNHDDVQRFLRGH